MSSLRPDAAGLARIPRPVITRFAPSPTGYLHLGHVVNAIFVWGMAGAVGGAVRVRMEDHDATRCRPEYERAILEDLAWLAFPGVARTAVVRQRERAAIYADALARLRRTHHVYACDCSRSEIGRAQYTGRCRDRNLREGPGLGLRVVLTPGIEVFDDLRLGRLAQEPAAQCGDLLLRDRHGHWTYHFAVTVDDLTQGVTLVVRGADLVESTGRQVRLAGMLRDAGVGEAAASPVYLHHPLVYGEDGAKLSKSSGSAGVRMLRAAGVAPEDVIGRAATAVGLTAAGSLSGAEVAALFQPRSAVI